MMGFRLRASRGPWRSHLRAVDAVSTATLGIRTRKGRAVLTALGIAIGIAAILAVIGITSSSKAELIAQIDALGTNLLQVRPGNDLFGEGSTLPPDAPSMIRRIVPVQAATSLIKLNATVRPTPFVSRDDPIGIDLYAAEPNLIDTLDGRMASGHFFDSGTDDLPVVVLGSVAAQRLGIDTVEGGRNILIAGKWFNLIGIVDPLQLNPDIDRAAIIGQDIAVDLFGVKRNASVIYLRAEPEHVEEVRGVLAATANPAAPNEVEVSRPSEALEARAQVDKNLQTLLLSLGAVALLVGAIGIANVMVISVLERRSEIGVRRALGATRAHIGIQFIMESALLAFMGGVLGIGIGAAVTYAYARSQDWLGTVPLVALAGSVAVTLLLGVISGLYPAVRAARLDPVEAIRPTT
jgi:putative ABC transport system permease protein